MRSDESRPPQSDNNGDANEISRRDFLKLTSGAIVAASVASVAGGYGVDRLISAQRSGSGELFDGVIPDQSFAYADNVPPPMTDRPSDMLAFFTPDEAETLDALLAVMMPGTPDDPGAREAGVLFFIDRKLSTPGFQFVIPTYFDPPFADTYEGDAPPESIVPRVWVKKDQLDRYGFQSRLTPREFYRAGLVALNAHSQSRFGSKFSELESGQQEQVVGDLSNGEADSFTEPSAEDFFDEVREDIAEGMFSDPAYGGNKDMVGWKLVGYPGAQRAFTPGDMLAEGPPRDPQSLAQMHAFNPGTGNGPAILPVSEGERARDGRRGDGRRR